MPKRKQVSRRRTPAEVSLDMLMQKQFRSGFAVALILHAEKDPDPVNMAACSMVFNALNYTFKDFSELGLPLTQLQILQRIFSEGTFLSEQFEALSSFVKT